MGNLIGILLICFFGFFMFLGAAYLVVFIFFGIKGVKERQKSKRQRQTNQEYLDALNTLRKDPTNQELKMKALSVGHEFLAEHRPQGVLTAQDKINIEDDIKAACGDKKQEYLNSLTILRRNPTNSMLKMKALTAGREYLGEHRQLTTQDEIAIGNDINAASGGK